MFIVRSSPKREEVRQRTRTSVETKAIKRVRFIRTARLFNDGLNFTASISLFAKCCLKFHHVLSVPYFPRKHALHAHEVSSLLFNSLFFHFHRFMFEIGIQVERYMNSGSFFAEYLDEGREITDRPASGFHFQIYLGRVEDQFCLRKTPSGFTFTFE